jgi:hypothetical protein
MERKGFYTNSTNLRELKTAPTSAVGAISL